ncbi:phospholipid binding [Ascochyta rabiei]|uniref:Phospholipid binding n=1 Tax=Didymella rabiei TaxID=5454 RepID=A0A163E690_DIDRA|nr:phospholipid binding [Ascochyta rabiei]
MATSAHAPPGALVVDDYSSLDPFTTHDGHRQRYSAFDNAHFSLYLNGSPAQAKRALEAHLAETTRRLQETSHLGNALVQQRQELEQRLHEVEGQQADNDIGPELRARLAELEKEFNEVGRETARAFLPKSRVPSGESDANGGSVYASEAMQSPTKVSVPSRKQRNQQPSRIQDITLATEISTSLLSQLKELQAVLLEKDEALKAADLDRSNLEIEVEGLSQRLRTLDESDSRLKDVNWSLETQVREFEAQSKSASDKEHRLNYALNLAKSEKSTLEREFEELKGMHAKLNDDHINKSKQHETELSGLRRNLTMGESERNALQRKVEELSTQNQELAKAVAYRMRGDEHNSPEEASPEESFHEGESLTPEHSPPPSPSKATPRHGQLESETLKHSLQHAHRMIQQLKNNIHREKTEKIELKRMLQDARDEIESNRSESKGPGSASKRKKTDRDVFKKPARPDRLGALRQGKQEVVMELDDDEWEEQDIIPSPSKPQRPHHSVPEAFNSGYSSMAETSANEAFETANEVSDADFDTANDDGTTTETDAFQTGAETLDGESSDESTETEMGSTQGTIRNRSPIIRRSQSGQSYRDTYESTASNSDYDSERDTQTPGHNRNSSFRFLRPSSSRKSVATPRGSLQDIFHHGTPPMTRDSPASNSNNSTPAQGRSLFAELDGLSGGEDTDSAAEGTPSRSSLLSPDSSPEKGVLGRSPLQRTIPMVAMIDSSTMTELDAPQHVGVSSIHDIYDVQPQAPLPAALHLSSLVSQGTSPQAPLPQQLQLSAHAFHHTEPKLVVPPSLNISNVSGQATSPQTPALVPLAISSTSFHDTSPRVPTAPPLGISTMETHHSQHTAPQSPPAPAFDFSSVAGHATSPRAVPPPALGVSSVSGHTTEPRSAPAPDFNLSLVSGHETEPRAAPAPSFNMSSLSAHMTEPRDVPRQSFGMSEVSGHASEPKDAPRHSFDISSVSGHATEPQDVPRQLFNMSSVTGHASEPRDATPRAFDMSSVSGHTTEPQHAQATPLHLSNFSSHSTAPVEPTGERGVRQAFGMSSMVQQSTEPREGQGLKALAPAALFASGIAASQMTEPREASRSVDASSEAASVPDSRELNERELVRQAPLQMSSTSAHSTAPVEVPRAPLSTFSTMSSQATEPYQPKTTPLQLSMHSSQTTEPFAPKQAVHASSIHSFQATEPVVPKQAIHQFSMPSSQATEPFAPQPVAHQLSVHSAQTTEPVTPQQQTLQMSTLASKVTEPIILKPQSLEMSTFASKTTVPVIPEPQSLQLSWFAAEATEPVAPKSAVSGLSSLSFQASEPVEAPKAARPVISATSSQTTEPVHPRAATSTFSMFSSQTTEPLEPRKQALPKVSLVTAQHTEPFHPAAIAPDFSDVKTLQSHEPESPTVPSFLPTPSRPSTANRVSAPPLSMSSLFTEHSEPKASSRPVTARRTVPAPWKLDFSDAMLPWNQGKQVEQETAPTSDRAVRTPLTPISTNATQKAPRMPMTDGGTQTMVSAEQIDKLLLARSNRYSGTIATADVEKSLSPPDSPSRRHSGERLPRRPGSSGSIRSRAASPPPLPADHKQVIAAAALKQPLLPPTTPGTMGPPVMPASAYKKPSTPSLRTGTATLTPKTGGTTPRARPRSTNRSDARSGASSPISRRSSISSFTSEVDQRFNIAGGPSFAPPGVPVGATDPRMIQAITQTMIGEYLWKYTRKTLGGGMSDTRHRRFFWIHPYTRTLYWSDRDPQTAGKTELKAKSVAIESVEEVEDSNPMPPGLHQKSLLVFTPGRSIKFTAATGKRHETWYNALSYLCQRVEEGSEQPEQKPSESPASNEIQDEFNAGYRSASRATGRSRASMSSRVSRHASASRDEVPTLRQHHVTPQRAPSTEPGQAGSMSGRFSSMLRPNSAMRGSFSSRRSRITASTFEEPSNATMDLSREIHDHVERDIEGLVNVRACCDGKHDVGHLHMHTVKSRHNGSNNLNNRPSFIGSLTSRSSSRADTRAESRTESRTNSRTESHAEARDDRIRHQTDMEAANFSAGG